MAKKAPAKRAPRKPPATPAIDISSLSAEEPVKPSAEEPVKPAIDISSLSAEDLERLRDLLRPPKPPRWWQKVDWRRWLVRGAKAALIFIAGAVAGILIAGGIPIGPDNGPEPTPTPEPVKSFRVIFVKESGQTLSSEQVAIPGAKEIRDFLNAKTTAEGNQPGWREYDPQQITDSEQPTMKALWEAVKPKLLPAPCLVLEVNGKATVMPFPATVAEAVETLKKAGG
jgi:hypothetical protein